MLFKDTRNICRMSLKKRKNWPRAARKLRAKLISWLEN